MAAFGLGARHIASDNPLLFRFAFDVSSHQAERSVSFPRTTRVHVSDVPGAVFSVAEFGTPSLRCVMLGRRIRIWHAGFSAFGCLCVWISRAVWSSSTADRTMTRAIVFHNRNSAGFHVVGGSGRCFSGKRAGTASRSGRI